MKAFSFSSSLNDTTKLDDDSRSYVIMCSNVIFVVVVVAGYEIVSSMMTSKKGNCTIFCLNRLTIDEVSYESSCIYFVMKLIHSQRKSQKQMDKRMHEKVENIIKKSWNSI